jgi:hypothetical protein
MVPLYFSMFFGGMAYFTECYDLNTRLQLILALFLTCFAIQWTLLERLPKFPFLTVLDNVAYSVVMSLFLMGAGFCVSYFVAREKTHKECNDPSCITYNLWKGETADAVFAGLVACYLFLYSLAYKLIYLVFFNKKTLSGGAYRRWCEGLTPRNKFFRATQAWKIVINDAFIKRGVFLGMGQEIPWRGKETVWAGDSIVEWYRYSCFAQ